ncbi:hypothetical protein P0L94_00880 [Microbacter sp. GSS18]|nr:hypothetical protein P0L94_00880 [Microbacter sp. GSS18]
MDVEEFRAQDREWRRRLQGLSLVAEANVDAEDSIAALSTLFERVRRMESGKQRVQLLKRYAATTLVGLAGVASVKYEEGTFWPRISDVAEWEITQPWQALLSNTFRYGLDLLGLSRFDTPLRNLGEILMHAGIPVASVGSFLRALQKKDTGTYDLSGSDLCAWASSLTRSNAAAKGLDAPTWRFLANGGDVSADLVDRFLAVLDASQGSSSVDELPLEALPTHLGDEVKRLLLTGDVGRAPGRRRSREARLIPRLIYADGELQIDLPAFERRLGADVTWQITAAGESKLRRVRAPWPGDIATPNREAVQRPATKVVVALQGRELEWAIPVVDTTSPLLVFDANSGEALASGSQLPKGRAWVAFPNESDRDISDALEHAGELTIVEHVDAPYGWDGWSFALVDLSKTHKLRPRSDGDFRWRYVSSLTRPTLEDVPTLSHLRAASGRFILSERPRIVLPAARADSEIGVASTLWTISVTNSEGEVLNTVHHESALEPVAIDPWPDEAGTLVGEFQLRAQGPLGRGATHDIAIAEGVSTSSTTGFRWFSSHSGLDDCAVRIESSGHVDTVVLDGATRGTSVTIPDSLGAPALSAATDIDFMWVATATGTQTTKPGIGPAQLETESLPDSLIRLNTVPRLQGTITVAAGGADVQVIPADANATGIALVNLATIADTAERHGAVTLRYDAADRSTAVAVIRPRQLIANLFVEDGQLHVAKNGESVPLDLGVYLDFAPWRTPEALHIPADSDMVAAPRSLRGRGPAVVVARVDDPWTSDEWPQMPPKADGNLHHLELPVEDLETLDDAFLAWVGGELPLPSLPEAVPFAIEIYGSLRRSRTPRPRYELFSDIAQLTIDHGDTFLDAVRASSWSRSTHGRLIAEGWAATAAAGDLPVDSTTWTLSPFLGVVESMGRWRSERDELADQVEATLGASARTILEDGRDEHASVGAFRHEAEILSDWPAERIDAVWRAAAPVPGALLNGDQRMLHARELFDSRISPRTRDIARTSHGVLRRTHAVLQDTLGDRVRGPIGARSGSDGWPSLPCLSISIALLARLAARGYESAIEAFGKYRSGFADMAEAAPSFIEQDLVLAELWMTRWENE